MGGFYVHLGESSANGCQPAAEQISEQFHRSNRRGDDLDILPECR